MTVRIGSNSSVLGILRSLSQNTKGLSNVYERLSSGQRINRASDDAAGLSIADNLNAKSRVFGQAIRNINDGASLINIAEGALGQLSTIVIRQRELAEQAANGTYSTTQRFALQKESDALVKEYNRIVQSTSFNGQYILDGTDDLVRIQQGYGVEQSTLLGIGQQVGTAAGAGTVNSTGVNVTATGFTDVGGRVIGDINNDGFLDIVGSNGGNQVTAALGRGDGTFAPTAVQSNGSNILNAGFAGLADINNDGNLDLLAVGNDGRLNYAIGNGSGGFSGGGQFSSAVSGYVGGDRTVKDLNGDGIADVIGSDSGNGTIFYWYGRGDGTFQDRVTMAGGASQTSFEVGDVNNDGRLDIVGAQSGVYTQQADGTFSRTAFTLGVNASVRLGDVDNDGNLDIANLTGANIVQLRIGNGNGTFQSAQTLNFAWILDQLELRDINDDGNLDFIGGRYNTSSGAALGNGRGSFTTLWSNSSPIGGANARLLFGDFNSDGVEDIVSSTSGLSSNDDLYFLDADASGRRANFIERYDLTSVTGAREALTTTQTQLRRISLEVAALGAAQSRMTASLATLEATRENLEAARSRILDVDVAGETAELTRRNILTQFGASILAQAKLEPQLAIKLLSA